MLVKKYDYHTLSRLSENGRRLYQTPDGARVPSVTTVLEKTKPEESRQALAEWKRRVGTERASRSPRRAKTQDESKIL